ncbi:IS110 family transposase, partial [Ruoffia tabacinasalis]
MKTSINLERMITLDVIALDVSNGRSYVVHYSDNTCLFEGWMIHNQEGLNGLLARSQLCQTIPEIVFEATGVYSRVIERFCQDHHFDYYLLNPLEARKQTDSLRVNKTDKSDAHKLALTHYFIERKKKVVIDKAYQEMTTLSRWYESNEQDIKYARNHLHAFLTLSFPELESYFSSVASEYALEMIQLFPHPDSLRSYSRTKVKNLILNNTQKNISQTKALLEAESILTIAKDAYPAVDNDSLETFLVIEWASKLQQLVQQKKVIQKKLIDSAHSFKEFYVYTSFSGIGELTAALLIAELGDITRFDNPKQLNAFVGIDIRRFQSGNSPNY